MSPEPSIRECSASTPIGDAHLRLAYRADETDWTALEVERKRRERRTRGQSEEPPAERWERREWEQQADVTLGCEPDFPGDER